MATTKTEKRNITKEDVFLEARIRSEGARIEMKGNPVLANAYTGIVMDGCEIVATVMPNPRSRLDIVIDGDRVTISEMGEVLGTGTLEERPAWRDKLLSDGTKVQDALPWNPDIASIFLSYSCNTANSGNGCKYCACTLPAIRDLTASISPSDLEKRTANNVEAVIIGLQNGYRGTVLFTGGTPPPSERGQATDDLERIMDQIRESVDEEILSQIHFSEACFSPPDDLGILHKWKEIGLNSTEFDSQVVAPAFFDAICPGRGAQILWDEAQAASAEVFGRGRGATTAVVMGIEPMDGLLEGVEERLQKGVFPQAFIFFPIPGTPLGGFRPPTAEWIVEASEKIVDLQLKYADTFEVDLTEDTRFGYTRRGRSFYLGTVDDEMARRLQEMGKLGPGLPKQGAADN